eukprot:m.535054 g.535054  ORF g.535054 m.535054 type:complete len:87 (+) comp22062_c0_seq5:289-549(+)
MINSFFLFHLAWAFRRRSSRAHKGGDAAGCSFRTLVLRFKICNLELPLASVVVHIPNLAEDRSFFPAHVVYAADATATGSENTPGK